MKLIGLAVSEGVAIGPVYRYKPFDCAVSRRQLEAGETEAAAARYHSARRRARLELEALHGRLAAEHPEKAAIFAAHLDILFDAAMEEEILACIAHERVAEDWAVDRVYAQYAALLSEADDALISERAADIVDVKIRLLRCLAGEEDAGFAALTTPSVILAHDLLPSDTASLDRALTLGIITEVGGATSHSAIIARGFGIPAVLGVQRALEHIEPQSTVILDAVDGAVLLSPTPQEIADYTEKREAFRKKSAQLERYLRAQPLTRDGVHVEVDLNIGGVGDAELAGADFTDGVGLFRTEFLFMGRSRLPDEEEQRAAYTRVLDVYGDRPVIFRTLDAGGDKKLDALSLPVEENPFLGNRALRLCLSRPDIFHTQLRACLRAGAGKVLWLMFPMVGSLEDIRAAKEAVRLAETELKAQGLPHCENVKLGIMVEIPSIALMAAEAACEVDFASIGTNDLTQYLLAVDRMNPAVTAYYQMFHPAVFRLIKRVADAFIAQGKPVGVCGELGGNKLAIPALIGFGIRKLSMGASSVAAAKQIVCGLTLPQAQEIAQTVCATATAAETEADLQRESSRLTET